MYLYPVLETNTCWIARYFNIVYSILSLEILNETPGKMPGFFIALKKDIVRQRVTRYGTKRTHRASVSTFSASFFRPVNTLYHLHIIIATRSFWSLVRLYKTMLRSVIRLYPVYLPTLYGSGAFVVV